MAQVVVTGPDGARYRVTAPEGASDADIIAYVQQNVAGAGAGRPAAAPAPAATPRSTVVEKPSDLGYIANAPARMAAGLTQVLVGGAGEAATTLARTGLRVFGARNTDDPDSWQRGLDLGSAWQGVQKVTDRYDTTPNLATGREERTVPATGIGRFLGTGAEYAIPIGGAAKGVETTIRAMAPLARNAAAAAPVVTGVAAGTADVLAPDTLAAPIAGLVGGLGTAAVPAVVRGLEMVTGPLGRASREREVTRILQSSATTPDPAALASTVDQGIAQAGQVGVSPTIGAASGDDGLQALERGVRLKRPELFAARDRANVAALSQATADLPGPGAPAVLRTAAEEGNRIIESRLAESLARSVDGVTDAERTAAAAADTARVRSIDAQDAARAGRNDIQILRQQFDADIADTVSAARLRAQALADTASVARADAQAAVRDITKGLDYRIMDDVEGAQSRVRAAQDARDAALGQRQSVREDVTEQSRIFGDRLGSTYRGAPGSTDGTALVNSIVDVYRRLTAPAAQTMDVVRANPADIPDRMVQAMRADINVADPSRAISGASNLPAVNRLATADPINTQDIIEGRKLIDAFNRGNNPETAGQRAVAAKVRAVLTDYRDSKAADLRVLAEADLLRAKRAESNAQGQLTRARNSGSNERTAAAADRLAAAAETRKRLDDEVAQFRKVETVVGLLKQADAGFAPYMGTFGGRTPVGKVRSSPRDEDKLGAFQTLLRPLGRTSASGQAQQAAKQLHEIVALADPSEAAAIQREISAELLSRAVGFATRLDGTVDTRKFSVFYRDYRHLLEPAAGNAGALARPQLAILMRDSKALDTANLQRVKSADSAVEAATRAVEEARAAVPKRETLRREADPEQQARIAAALQPARDAQRQATEAAREVPRAADLRRAGLDDLRARADEALEPANRAKTLSTQADTEAAAARDMAAAARKALADTQEQAVNLRSTWAKQPLSSFMGQEPVEAVRKILESSDPAVRMAKLSAAIGDNETMRAGLRAAIGEVIKLRGTGTQKALSDTGELSDEFKTAVSGMERMLKRPGAAEALRTGMGADGFQNLQNIVRELQRMDAAARAVRAPTTGGSAPSAVRRLFESPTGAGVGSASALAYFIVDPFTATGIGVTVGSAIANRRAAQTVLAEALADPVLGRRLLQAPTPQNLVALSDVLAPMIRFAAQISEP